MVDLVQFEDYLKLPDTVQQAIYSRVKIADAFFTIDLKISIEEIEKISNERMRLNAYVDLKSYADTFLEKFRNEYKNYLESLEGCHLSSKFFGSFSYIPGSTSGGSLSKNKEDIPYSIEQNEFYISEIDYNKALDHLVETIKRLSIRLEIEEKYKYKRKIEKKIISLPVADTKSNFLNLFVTEEIANKFLNLLFDDDYLTDDERWIGKSSRPGELRDAYLALEKLGLLKTDIDHLYGIKTFYSRFDLSVYKDGETGTISERSCRKTDKYQPTVIEDKFIKILEHLTTYKR